MNTNFLNITLLCGFKRAGKDTVAEVLQKQFDYTHYKISTPLKETLKILFNFSDKQLEGDEKDMIDPRINKTPRDVMKYVGTNMFQHHIQEFIPYIGRSFWVDALLKQIESKHIMNTRDKQNVENIVISDLRFTHEHNAFMYFTEKYPDKVKVNIVKIIRNDVPRYYNIDKHESEIDHLNFKYHYVIQNKVDVDTLTQQTIKLHKQIQSDIRDSVKRVNMII